MVRDVLEMAPLILPILLFLTPLVWVLTQHQRKMAEMLHERTPAGGDPIEMLARDVAELKQLVNQQALAIDSLAGELRGQRGHVEARLEGRTY